MIIGGVRLEEAKVFDSKAGTQEIPCYPHPIKVEVFWSEGPLDHANPRKRGGWYCSSPVGEYGPFARSSQALDDCEAAYSEMQEESDERALAYR